MNPPAPKPVSWLSVTNEVSTAQIAASTALPPSRNTWAPASAVSGCPAATTPLGVDMAPQRRRPAAQGANPCFAPVLDALRARSILGRELGHVEDAAVDRARVPWAAGRCAVSRAL